jgi:TonB family protein
VVGEVAGRSGPRRGPCRREPSGRGSPSRRSPVAVEAPSPEPVESNPPAPAEIADTASTGAANTVASAADGAGPGPGVGRGDGAGVADGSDRGFGGGAYRPGNGVTSPVPLRRVPPAYTADAMRARAQGVVAIECVVEPNGECGELRVVRAFKPPHGLDQEAIAAARRWRFRPGTRDGQPVPVLVNLEIEFNIR